MTERILHVGVIRNQADEKIGSVTAKREL